MKQIFFTAVFFAFFSMVRGQGPQTIHTRQNSEGNPVTVSFLKGQAHNHPLMAIWLEDSAGNYIETLYVAQSIATSQYPYGEVQQGKWKKGVNRRPAALPYWAHKRGVMAKDSLYLPHPDNPMPDAVSGATPKGDFTLHSTLPENIDTPFYVMLEINQPWDWNDYWTNNKYPDDEDYKTSSQPAVIYQATIRSTSAGAATMKLKGRSHHSGANGKLYNDLHTLTTAKEIVKEAKVTLP
jgi:hypothetical protein